MELAIWFHDAGYKPLSKNNELASAKWASQLMEKAGLSSRNVNNLIMATAHNCAVAGRDEALIIDIDLAILGAEAAVYDVFESNVRQEYKRVPYFIYRKKRKEILRYFLERENIYNLNCFRDKFESNARDNLSRAIVAL